jgi:hypothetical protein
LWLDTVQELDSQRWFRRQTNEFLSDGDLQTTKVARMLISLDNPRIGIPPEGVTVDVLMFVYGFQCLGIDRSQYQLLSRGSRQKWSWSFKVSANVS